MGKRKQPVEDEGQSHTDGHVCLGLGLESGAGLGWASISEETRICASTTSNHAIQDSNIGFQLLKKCGWKEGSGLGIAEQGRLDPIETHVKHDKRGIGAEKKLKKMIDSAPNQNAQKKAKPAEKKSKPLSKRLRKLQAEEKRMQEKAFEQDFFREFWPDNV
eukprot:Gb_04524 [translate_table: standard]